MTDKLKFGVNPFDRCPKQRERYHLIDPQGYIVFKSALGYTAFDYAGNLSDRLPGVFSVIDTRDGSEYGAYQNGECVR